MKNTRLVVCIVCTIVAIAAAVTALVIFRNEIIYFFSDLKDKLDEKKLHLNGEYEDYADV